MLTTLPQTDAVTKLLLEKGIITDREPQAEAVGGTCGVSADFEPDNAMIPTKGRMSRQLKVILFVLAFNIIGFAEGYLLHELGLLWLVPIILVTAFGAVLLSRRLL
jgi:hypothetical protein